MTPRKKFWFTIILGFIAALFIGTTDKLSAELLVWPDKTLIIYSITAAFALTAFLFGIFINDCGNKKWFVLALIGLLFSIGLGLAAKSWSAENIIKAKDNYAAIMKEAENWPVIDEILWGNVNITTKTHQDPNNPNKVLVSKWFLNKRNQPELFAKSLFTVLLNRNGGFYLEKELFAMLKTKNNEWMAGDFMIITNVAYNDKDFIAFKLFRKKAEHHPVAVRFFKRLP